MVFVQDGGDEELPFGCWHNVAGELEVGCRGSLVREEAAEFQSWTWRWRWVGCHASSCVHCSTLRSTDRLGGSPVPGYARKRSTPASRGESQLE